MWEEERQLAGAPEENYNYRNSKLAKGVSVHVKPLVLIKTKETAKGPGVNRAPYWMARTGVHGTMSKSGGCERGGMMQMPTLRCYILAS